MLADAASRMGQQGGGLSAHFQLCIEKSGMAHFYTDTQDTQY
jgi:hypothetical protein